MIRNRRIIGAHGLFFRDGIAFTLPAPGTAGRAALPGPTDPVWIDLGIADYDINPTNKTEEFMAPNPGARVVYDIITLAKGLKLKVKFKELSNILFQLVHSSATVPDSPTAGGAYVPLAGEAVIRGWLALTQKDGLGNTLDTKYYFVAMEIKSDLKGDDKAVDVDVEMTLLQSALNAGTFG